MARHDECDMTQIHLENEKKCAIIKLMQNIACHHKESNFIILFYWYMLYKYNNDDLWAKTINA